MDQQVVFLTELILKKIRTIIVSCNKFVSQVNSHSFVSRVDLIQNCKNRIRIAINFNKSNHELDLLIPKPLLRKTEQHFIFINYLFGSLISFTTSLYLLILCELSSDDKKLYSALKIIRIYLCIQNEKKL